MMNITIAGNIGKDAEVRNTQSGPVAGFSVAVSEGRDKPTTWFDVSLFGKRGESLAQYLTKGTRVTVNGRFSTREHEGKTYFQVNANDIALQGGGERQQGSNQSSGSKGGYGGGQGGGFQNDLDGDDIPFAPEVR
jgi:single-strand DNA-binding protein